MGSQYNTAMDTIYTSFTEVMNHILYIYVFEIFSLSYCREVNRNILILDIDNQNITFVYASEGNPSCMFELQSSISSKCLTCSNSALEEHVD